MTSSLDSNYCPASDFFKFGNKKKVTRDQIWRIRWIGQQFLVQFDQIGHGNGKSVSQCIVMVEEHFFLCQMGSFFCNSASNRPNNLA
jgi:hypothetical protein